MEILLSWLCLIIYLFTRNLDYLKVSGIFAIAGNVNEIWHELKERKYK